MVSSLGLNGLFFRINCFLSILDLGFCEVLQHSFVNFKAVFKFLNLNNTE